MAGLMLALATAGFARDGAGAQEFGDLASGQHRTRSSAYVSYAPEPTTVAARKRAMLEVRLRVAKGFHINSHRPKSGLLIPTAITWEPYESGIAADEIEYPAGTPYRFASNPAEALDVYTGAVVLRIPVTATAGEHMLRGVLRFQACDDRACYPPKTLAVDVPFTAR